jgi:uncharacterized repeat protein (TIGR03803 family)
MGVAAHAQTFTVLKMFNGTNGGNPTGPPVEAFDGKLYGTTLGQGANNGGTIFKYNISKGGLGTVYNFCSSPNCADGGSPVGGLLQGMDGYLYGTAWGGGTNNTGAIFRVTTNGAYNPFYSFCADPNCPDGAQPQATMVQGSTGFLYGTTIQGGAFGSNGVVFEVFPSSLNVITLWSFCAFAGCTDGSYAHSPLIQGMDGYIYGTNEDDGVGSQGTVFQLSPAGSLTTLYSFCSLPNCTDGRNPGSGVIQATDGNFYGVTSGGGTTINTACGDGCGTIFRLTPLGVLTTLHSFNSTDGKTPVGLMQGTDGNLYGTTELGGAHNKGTIFQMTLGGTFTSLHSFSFSDGFQPWAGLMQATDGNFYGTTAAGGSNISLGTLFRLSMGLAPFVKTFPVAAHANQGLGSVQILGQNISAATSVTFNGTPAPFAVINATTIYTEAPTGATDGPVVVTTPTGVLTSQVHFRVLP